MFNSKFNKLFQKIITENKIILENGKYGSDADIPRPNRMKTPENYFGDTGRNAKEYDLYIQDEAEAVFQDKYGKEKGTRMWEGILSVGNAMWKACDQILGERLSMEDDLMNFFCHHSDLNSQCSDLNNWINQSFYKGSYIVDWVWWILSKIIDGQYFTKSYIQGCYPTFNGVLKLAPITTAVLLEAAGIDLDQPLIIPKPAKIQQPVEELPIVDQPEVHIHDTTNIIQNQDPITNNTEFTLNGNKDHDRIIGILEKSRVDKTIPLTADTIKGNIINFKAIQLATTMNNKITGEDKRARRRQACIDLGLDWLAKCFE